LGRITKTVCDIFVNAHDFTPAERGSWGRETSRCRVCERSHSKQRHPTQKTSLSNALACVREIGESTNPDPLPKNWEIVVSEAEHHPYSLATAIEDRMRLILGDVSRGDYIYRWNADHLQHHANGIYTDALRVFSRNRVSANPELAVLRALDHPRLLFCDTVHARLVRPQLATNLERMKEAVVSGLFDGWVPSEPTPWTRRQFLTRCAAAANHVEDQLRYYSGSNDRKYYRRVAAPDMEAPSPTPPRVRKPKTN
jgi:hypothetical protein